MNCVYFIGIGGIGMSAIARYFLSRGWAVAGYDLTPSDLTRALEAEGIDVHYEDGVEFIPEPFRSPETLVIYTPAVPRSHSELCYYEGQGNKVLKRSECLGEVVRGQEALCVAGTHGKTTTSAMLAHLLYQSHVGCNAFLGGVSNNYKSNLLLKADSPLVVLEADEFDRSFHRLTPRMAIVTSADPDHLDIYGSADAYRESFEHFTSLIEPGGVLVMRKGIPLTPRLQEGVRLFSYASDEEADFWASDIEQGEGQLSFTWHYPSVQDRPSGSLRVDLGVPLRINVDNAVAAMAVALLNGATLDELREGIKSFRGVYRRFDRVLDLPDRVLIDDYAHHPIELEASIRSVRALYPERRILGIFQPHLYSRTQDFYKEFASSLDLLDEVVLLDIYPARELPIEGVSSQLIAGQMQTPVVVLPKDGLLPHLSKRADIPPVVLMLGAGDIDRLVRPVSDLLAKG